MTLELNKLVFVTTKDYILTMQIGGGIISWSYEGTFSCCLLCSKSRAKDIPLGVF